MKTQCDVLWSHLVAGHCITQLDALSKYGIGRLSARVHQLRQCGRIIRTKLVTVRTRGGRARIAVYSSPERA
jgi:hypothetical protein